MASSGMASSGATRPGVTRIVHLTDLHFGCESPGLVAPLHAAVRQARPDLVVVTGDLSHRARAAQFRAAVAFLDGLGARYVTMPGNHDVPLFDLAARVLWPFRGWRRAVGAGQGPQVACGTARVFCANTADPMRWRGGVLRKAEQQQMRDWLAQGDGGAVNILACHHPLVVPPGFDRGETRGASAALATLAGAGLQVVLSGHLHHWDIGPGITATTPRPVLHVQTGTALCGRAGERDHGFAVLEIAAGAVAVTPWQHDAATGAFVPQPVQRFRRAEGGWLRDVAPGP